jgi:hypothetical protein
MVTKDNTIVHLERAVDDLTLKVGRHVCTIKMHEISPDFALNNLSFLFHLKKNNIIPI